MGSPSERMVSISCAQGDPPRPALACGPSCWNPRALVPPSVRRGDPPAQTQTQGLPGRLELDRCGQMPRGLAGSTWTRPGLTLRPGPPPAPRQRAHCTCPERALQAGAGTRGCPPAHTGADHGLGRPGPAQPECRWLGGGPGASRDSWAPRSGSEDLREDTLPRARRTLGDRGWALTSLGLGCQVGRPWRVSGWGEASPQFARVRLCPRPHGPPPRATHDGRPSVSTASPSGHPSAAAAAGAAACLFCSSVLLPGA